MSRWRIGVSKCCWRLRPPILLRVPELLVDRRVLVYAVGLSVLTGLVVGLVPAVSVARRSMAPWLRTGGFAVTPSPRVRQFLVISQVALTLVLLCGAGLLVWTLLALSNTQNGLERHNVLTMEIQLSSRRYTPERTTAFSARRWPPFARFPASSRRRRVTAFPLSGRVGEGLRSIASARRSCP